MMQVADQLDTITIQITGRFDFRVIKEFQQLLGREPRTWIIDLGGVDYVDSSALGMLLLLKERADARALTVSLVNCRGIVKEILTPSPTHPHGIKVRLTSGAVGRVKAIVS